MKTILIAMILVCLLVQPVLASSGEPPALAAQTSANDDFPWLALLVFLVPLGIMLYKSRGKKAPDMKTRA